ncbi:MAG TPA: hypothetical protein VKY73_15210 [Polyangiaceae bacterium]|nr:hypothetical protein [Polyangiaceae bacterium]
MTRCSVPTAHRSRIVAFAQCVLVALSAPGLAFARGETDAETAAPTAPPLVARLDVGGRDDIDTGRLRGAIERELGLDVGSGDGAKATLSITVESENRATIRYQPATGAAITRTVDLPADRERAIDVIAWVAGNLVRDEASELLRALAAQRAAPEPEAEAPASAPEQSAPEPPTAAPSPEPEAASPAGHEDEPLKPTPFNVAFISPLALYSDAEHRSFAMNLGLFLYSRVGAVNGLALEAGVVRLERDLRGAALAGAAVTAGGAISGVVGSGALVHADVIDGIAVTGGAVVGGSARGVVLSGAANVIRESTGAVVSGGANVSERAIGVHFSPVNVADTFTGAQLGVINVGGHVRGAQVGVINVASEIEGASVGLINIAGNGRIQPLLWSSSLTPLHASVKFVAGWAYSEVGVAYDPSDDEYAIESGVGARLPVLAERLWLEPGVHLIETEPDNRLPWGDDAELGELSYRLRATVRLLPFVELFAGGGVRHRLWGEARPGERAELFGGIGLL